MWHSAVSIAQVLTSAMLRAVPSTFAGGTDDFKRLVLIHFEAVSAHVLRILIVHRCGKRPCIYDCRPCREIDVCNEMPALCRRHAQGRT